MNIKISDLTEISKEMIDEVMELVDEMTDMGCKIESICFGPLQVVIEYIHPEKQSRLRCCVPYILWE